SAGVPPQSENAVALSAGVRAGDPQGLPSHHASPAPADWLAALDVAAVEKDTGADKTDGGQEQIIALSGGDSDGTPTPQGEVLSGTVSFNLAAMERGVRRFFEHLQEQGRELTTQPGALALGSLLAAGAATTAA